MKKKNTYRAALKQDLAVFQSFVFFSLLFVDVQSGKSSFLTLKCKFHFISAVLLYICLCQGGGLPRECGATCGVIHLQYEL